MAKLKKVEVIEKLKKLSVEFDENDKYADLVKLLKEKEPKQLLTPTEDIEARFPKVLVKCAREVGFTDLQIYNFTDPKMLRQKIISIKPRLALKLRETSPPPPVKRVELIDADHVFEINILAGGGPASDLARREQGDIDREIRRRGIRNIDTMTIVRSNKPDSRGRKKSMINIKYKKEK